MPPRRAGAHLTAPRTRIGRTRKLLRTCAIIAAIGRSMSAQEPQPARITAAYFEQPDGVELTLPWLFAPGDEPGRESPQFDDSKWTVMSPLLDRPAAWPGTGWFRRHLLIAPSLQNLPVALRLTSPGIADLYLDGQLILHDGDAKTPEVPSEHRNAGIVTFAGPRHVLAIRYSYPRDARRPDEDIGF